MATVNGQRAELRAAGYTEAEISRILIEKEVAASSRQEAAGAFGQQAPMTGPVGNLNAVLSHVREIGPAIRSEAATAANRAVSAPRRFVAVVALVVVACVAGLLGFGVSLELNKLQGEARAVTAQAEIARQTALVADIRQQAEADKAKADAALSVANAEVARQTALVADVRQKAEANEATYKTEIAKQTALVADIRQRAEAALADANAKIAAANSVYAQRKAKAEAEEAEGRAKQVQFGVDYLNGISGGDLCFKSCKGKALGCMATCEAERE